MRQAHSPSYFCVPYVVQEARIAPIAVKMIGQYQYHKSHLSYTRDIYIYIYIYDGTLTEIVQSPESRGEFPTVRRVSQFRDEHRTRLYDQHASESDDQARDDEHGQVYRGCLYDGRHDDYDDTRCQDGFPPETVGHVAHQGDRKQRAYRLGSIDGSQLHTVGLPEVFAPLLEGLQPVHQRSCWSAVSGYMGARVYRPRVQRKDSITYHRNRKPKTKVRV